MRFVHSLCALFLLASVVEAQTPTENVLSGTKPLTLADPLDVVMVRGINRFAELELSLSASRREQFWNRDFSSREAYEKSIAPNRERFKAIIGAARHLGPADELVEQSSLSPARPSGPATRWMRASVYAASAPLAGDFPVDFCLFEGDAGARVILIPDAEWLPEGLTGEIEGQPESQQLARRLLERGIGSAILPLIDRSDEFSGRIDIRFTNQPHREFLYRSAFELGRHVIGYEVQKVRRLVEVLKRDGRTVVIWGVGEGGLIALYSAAVDPAIDACVVSGYFDEREGLWKEPIYRNVWRLLAEFGDANIASLIAPRPLIIEACAAPEIAGPPGPKPGRTGAAPGRIATPKLESVEREFKRTKSIYERLGTADRLQLVRSGTDGAGPCGTESVFNQIAMLARTPASAPKKVEPAKLTQQQIADRVMPRQQRMIEDLRHLNERLLNGSAKVRDQLWTRVDRTSLAKWEETQEAMREQIATDFIGRLPHSLLALNPRSRKVVDEATHVGYEIALDIVQSSVLDSEPIIAGGILLVPKNLKPGEKRPCVVCQHGLEGTPMDTIVTDPKASGYGPYKGFSTQLVKQGYIVYAPQNPYRGKDDFRVIQRKSNPLGWSLFSYIVPQHQQTLNWLATLPYVDANRIAFYGLSYGGKTAMRVPQMLPSRRSPETTALLNQKNWRVLLPGTYSFYSDIAAWDPSQVDRETGKANIHLDWTRGNKGGEIRAIRGDTVIAAEELKSFVSAIPEHDFVCISHAKNAEHVADPNTPGSSKWFENQLFAAGCKRVLNTRGLSSGSIVMSDAFADGQPVPGYCLSICSADFNEWVRKCTTTEDRYSYVFTQEYEIFEWNMAHTANYAELASLMTPRPFMVERGHDDGVAPDEWVAWEFAKVKRHYDKLGIGDRTEIEVFNGPHTINGHGTFQFLQKHLNWPNP